MTVRACTFDFGQTLATLDTTLLSEKLARVGLDASPASLVAELGDAWSAYDDAIRAGVSGHPWKVFMHVLLSRSTSGEGSRPELARAVDWLWEEQPRQNLWRQPIPGMMELCQDIAQANIPLGVLSNSEGKLRELIAEMGLSELLRVVADSGVLGIEKPDPRIFHWIARELGTDLDAIVHVGDSLRADVEGAVSVGMHAIWFSPDGGAGRADPSLVTRPDRVRICRDASEVRAALQDLGLAIGGAPPAPRARLSGPGS